MNPGLIVIIIVTIVVIILAIFNNNNNGNLNIASKTVGSGQHGSARWATNAEQNRAYKEVPFAPQKWRNGEHLPETRGIVVGSRNGGRKALIDAAKIHAIVLASPDAGKTAHILYPNLEYACASGASFVTLDTKGDLYRNYGGIAKDYYGYVVRVIDLRHPLRSDPNNLMYQVNHYTDLYKAEPKLEYRAKAEKYAKITAHSVVMAGGDNLNLGQNKFFYDAAEGLVTAAIMVVSEFGECGSRHIVSVFKIIQDLFSSDKPMNPLIKQKNPFAELLEKLPPEHKARLFAGAAVNSPEQSLASVFSTALSSMTAFIDSEIEQILCCDEALDVDSFVKEKTAYFFVLPEEDATKYFMVSLMLQQLTGELISIADEYNGELPRKVLMYLDEFGTVPKIEGIDKMFTAIRSRNVVMVAFLQSLSQLEKNYDKNGAKAIMDSCQVVISGGFSPLTENAETISKSLGSKTISTGSYSRGGADGKTSQSMQMMERQLMTPDELRNMPRGTFILQKTGVRPMMTRFPLFLRWGIVFDKQYTMAEVQIQSIRYTNKAEIEKNIIGSKKSSDVDEKKPRNTKIRT